MAVPDQAVNCYPDRLELQVWVQPRARSSEIVGWQDDALKIKLSVPPVEGRANQACVALLADYLGVAKGQVSLLRGEKSRRKTLVIQGDAARLYERLSDL